MKDFWQLLKAIFGFAGEWFHPDNKDLRTVQDIDAELEKLQKKMDAIIDRNIETKDDEQKQMDDLGPVIDRIVWLRRKRRVIEVRSPLHG